MSVKSFKKAYNPPSISEELMLAIEMIRNAPDRVMELLARKGLNLEETLEPILQLDRQRRESLKEFETKRAYQNKLSKQIGARRARGDDASELMDEATAISVEIKNLEAKSDRLGRDLTDMLLQLPNLPDEDCPVGKDKAANVLLETFGEMPQFDFTPSTHWDIGEASGWLDSVLGAKLAGSGFYALKGGLAKLERALISLMLDLHTMKHGYTEVATPYLARPEILLGTGQLPKFADDMYYDADDELYLIPTAEVTLANVHRETVLKEEQLPIYLCGYTPCFRKEAGAAGRDTRGLIRVHQFSKVELVKIVKPADSERELDNLVKEACSVLEALGLHYRTVLLSTGDMTFASAKTVDIEVYCPGVDRWLEVASCSNCRDFQARRMRTRYRPTGMKKNEFVHILNGSGVALPRLLVAIMETYQQRDGRVRTPDVLKPIFGDSEYIPLLSGDH